MIAIKAHLQQGLTCFLLRWQDKQSHAAPDWELRLANGGVQYSMFMCVCVCILADIRAHKYCHRKISSVTQVFFSELELQNIWMSVFSTTWPTAARARDIITSRAWMHLLHIQTTLFLLCDRFSWRSWNNAVDAHFSYEKTGHTHESSSMFAYYLSFSNALTRCQDRCEYRQCHSY